MDASGANQTSLKRSADDASSDRQARQKRDKYTLVACNECKKRKIKCSGDPVCQRCQDLSLSCVYASSGIDARGTLIRLQEMETRFAALERKVNAMHNAVPALQSLQSQLSTNPQASDSYDVSGRRRESCAESEPNVPRGRHRSMNVRRPQFVGPTSAIYSFDVGKSSLKIMGVRPDSGINSRESGSAIMTPCGSPEPQGRRPLLPKNALIRIGNDEAHRLIQVYSEELNPIYPFLDVNETVRHLERVQIGSRVSETEQPPFDSRDSDILMMVLASALTIEGLGHSILGEQITDAVEEARCQRSRTMQADLKEVILMTMMSVYHFHCDEDVLAWRTIGSAARLALEMGLHRGGTLTEKFPDMQPRQWAIKVFWCIYVLDRRWSLGTGMPFALQSSDIDPEVPEPDDTCPYLQCLVAYARISSKVWKAVNGSHKLTTKEQKDESSYLDFRTQQWQQSIPEHLKLLQPNIGDEPITQRRSEQRLRVLLAVRANHMRALIYRHNLLSATSIAENLADAEKAVGIAKDTIQILADLNRTSNIYHTQQACFNYFLVSALASLFLAVCHGPTYFSSSCRTEFYLALDLIKGFSAKSSVSRRLWKAIRELKEVGPRLGLTPTSEDRLERRFPSPRSDLQPQDHTTDGNTSTWFPRDAVSWQNSEGGSNIGMQMSYALTGLYDIAGGTSARSTQDGSMSLEYGAPNEYQNFSREQYPLEGNAAVSRLLEPLF